MPVVYRSDRSTGEVFETREYTNAKEKKSLLDEGWNETPRWHLDPKPSAARGNSPYEAIVNTPFQPFPQTLHGEHFAMKTVKSAAEKATALEDGWSETPRGVELVKSDGSESFIAYSKEQWAYAVKDAGDRLPGQRKYDPATAEWAERKPVAEGGADEVTPKNGKKGAKPVSEAA